MIEVVSISEIMSLRGWWGDISLPQGDTPARDPVNCVYLASPYRRSRAFAYFGAVRYLSNHARIAAALAADWLGRAVSPPWLAPGTLTSAVGTPLICSAA